MLKRIKCKNSTVILIGLLFIIAGVSIGFYEYFIEGKNNAFNEMKILLYSNETPKVVDNDSELEKEIKEEQKEETQTDNSTESNSDNVVNYNGILEIPKIGIKNGFFDIDNPYNNVDYNITVIKGSTFPDVQNNNLILAAHSGICSVCYFDKLYKLDIGDTANLYYNNQKYSYKIVNIYYVEKTGKVAIRRDYKKNTLTLITCTRNSMTQQTVYILELI